MNRRELQQLLEKHGVDPRSWSFGCDLPSERDMICQGPGSQWSYYYSERGQRSGLKVFDSEEAVCEYFVALLRRDGVLPPAD